MVKSSRSEEKMNIGRGRRDQVLLTQEQRKRLEAISRNGYTPAQKILHAQILLISDESEQATQRLTDGEIPQALIAVFS